MKIMFNGMDSLEEYVKVNNPKSYRIVSAMPLKWFSRTREELVKNCQYVVDLCHCLDMLRTTKFQPIESSHLQEIVAEFTFWAKEEQVAQAKQLHEELTKLFRSQKYDLHISEKDKNLVIEHFIIDAMHEIKMHAEGYKNIGDLNLW